MISYGNNIQQSGPESLNIISEADLFQLINEPAQSLKDLCEQLQQVVQLDKSAYNRLKTRLPYFCGSVFENNHRKLDNFKSAKYLILDLDDCFEDQQQFEHLRASLSADDRVMLQFVSPSRKGIKLVFSFREPVLSTKVFSDVYTAFSRDFAQKHEIEKYVDFKTKDATRVCFVCVDEEAHFNKLCADIDWKEYISGFDAIGQQELFPAKKVETALVEVKANQLEEVVSSGPGKEVYKSILATLNPGGRSLKQKQPVIVPEVLNRIIKPIRERLEGLGMIVNDIRDINYGKQWSITHMNALGEVKIHYGKKGFSVVKSNKSGTNPDLNEVLHKLIEDVLFTYNPEVTVF